MVEEWKPDHLHVHSPVLNALAALPVARRRGLPLLYEIRAFWEDAAVGNGTGREGSARYRATRMLETWAAGRADSVAVIAALLSPPAAPNLITRRTTEMLQTLSTR